MLFDFALLRASGKHALFPRWSPMICYRGVPRRRERVARSIYARKTRGDEGRMHGDEPPASSRDSDARVSRGRPLKRRRDADTCSKLLVHRVLQRQLSLARAFVASEHGPATDSLMFE